MVQRCENENHEQFSYYGGRGIAVCGEWRRSFPAFMSWALANGYTAGLTIDRLDNSLGYEPSNCRWATKSEQTANRREPRNSIYVEHGGRRMTLLVASAASGIGYTTLVKRYIKGLRDEALFAPVDLRKSRRA